MANRVPLGDLSNMERITGSKRTATITPEASPTKRARVHENSPLLCTEDSLQDLPPSSDCEDHVSWSDRFAEKLIGPDDQEQIQEPTVVVAEPSDHMFDEHVMKQRDEVYRPSSDLWSIQEEIRPEMRSTLIDWLYEVAESYELQRETTMIAVNYVDRFLSIENVSTNRLQLIGVAALFIAIKFQEVDAVPVTDLSELCGESVEAILEMEILLTDRLEWNLSPPTAFTWLRVHLERSREEGAEFPYSLLIRAAQLIDYFYLDHRSLNYSAGTIASACLRLFAMNSGTVPLDFDHVDMINFRACCTDLSRLESIHDAETSEKIDISISVGGDLQIYNPIALEYVKSVANQTQAAL